MELIAMSITNWADNWLFRAVFERVLLASIVGYDHILFFSKIPKTFQKEQINEAFPIRSFKEEKKNVGYEQHVPNYVNPQISQYIDRYVMHIAGVFFHT